MDRFIEPQTVEVYVENFLLPGWLFEDLFEARVQQRLSMPTQCELYFRGPDLMHKLQVHTLRLEVGGSLQVRLRPGAKGLFTGEITAVEYSYPAGGEPEIYVRAYDLLHRLRKQQNIRAYRRIGILDLAKHMAGPLGLQVVEPLHLPRESWPLIIQDQPNDLVFLTAQAASVGLYLSLQEKDLYLLTLLGNPTLDPIQLELEKNLFEARIEVNADMACDEVVAQGWDPQHALSVEAKAREPISGRKVLTQVDIKAVGGSPNRFLLNQAVTDANQARELAQAELDRRYAATVTFSGKAEGDARLRPGASVALSGVPRAVAGQYILTGVTHTVDSVNGYSCEVTTEAPQPPNLDQGDVITLGQVSDISDPQSGGMVKAKLLAYNNIETDWMQVLYPGAGSQKGFYSVPGVGDRVLLVLPRRNPAQGIVLGGLSGKLGLLANDIKTDESVWVTPSGQKIRMDATGDVIRLENRRGAYIQLSGGDIVIAASAVDFKHLGGL